MSTADIILRNANVITMEPGQPQAEAVAIKGASILLVASCEEVESLNRVGTRVIDCQGKTVVPGFNDAHCHIFSFVRKLLSLDLSSASVSSIDDIKAVIRQQAQNAPSGEWITGTDYNEFYLAEKRHPNRWDLDEVAPNHPVLLTHRSLHACVLNSRALSLAGITSETTEPPGGIMDRDLNTGEPNGLLFEMVGYLRERVLPPLSEAEIRKGINLVSQHYLSLGITSVQDATVVNDFRRWETIKRMKKGGELKSRVSMMFGIGALPEFQERGLTFGSGDSQLSLGAIKIMLHEATGEQQPPQSELNSQVSYAHQAGFQVAIHAIEQSSVEAAIIALESNQSKFGSGRRHRIEHCSQCPPRPPGEIAPFGGGGGYPAPLPLL
ncbi:amidohydrolase [Bacteroidota bacterium]